MLRGTSLLFRGAEGGDMIVIAARVPMAQDLQVTAHFQSYSLGSDGSKNNLLLYQQCICAMSKAFFQMLKGRGAIGQTLGEPAVSSLPYYLLANSLASVPAWME